MTSLDHPRVVRALGLHHTLATAVADIIDNSIDAGATHVLVRFHQVARQITAVRVVDNGRGMDSETLDRAMSYGMYRRYADDDQGYFGVGLKAASLSQANKLTVYSKSDSSPACAAGISVRGVKDEPVREAVSADAATAEMRGMKPRFPFATGTIVEWQGIRTFPVAADPDDQVAWLETAIGNLQSHLGLVFHRIIVAGLSITLDVFDVIDQCAGAPRTVRAIDPFGYRRSPDNDYPRHMAIAGGEPISALMHIWPAGGRSTEFMLHGLPGHDSQGFFVYRNDRLLHGGDWLGVIHPRPEYGLARVAIEYDSTSASHMTINPEKAGVTVDATLANALREELRTSGYLGAAEAVFRASRQSRRRPITVVEPLSGLPDGVIEEFADSFTFADSADPVSIGWRVLSGDTFFEVDLASRTLWLNARYRRRLGGTRGSDTDLPLIRTFVFLLAENMFDGIRLSARQSEQIQAWQRVLLSAMASDEESGE